MKGMNKILEAIHIAKIAHEGQTYDDLPYQHHLDHVVSMAMWLNYDEEIVIACALHDTLEDTDLTRLQISDFFGNEVANIVYAVTDEPGETRKERKLKTYPKIKTNWKAIIVKLLDRTANILYSIGNNPEKLNNYLTEHEEFVNAIITHETFHNKVKVARAVYYNAYNIARYKNI